MLINKIGLKIIAPCSQHTKVYDNKFATMSDPPVRPWICKTCGTTGVDEYQEKYSEYEKTTEKFKYLKECQDLYNEISDAIEDIQNNRNIKADLVVVAPPKTYLKIRDYLEYTDDIYNIENLCINDEYQLLQGDTGDRPYKIFFSSITPT